jgi:hypothetical protein
VLVDVTGSYSTCLYIFSGMLIFTAVLSGIFPFFAQKWNSAGSSSSGVILDNEGKAAGKV